MVTHKRQMDVFMRRTEAAFQRLQLAASAALIVVSCSPEPTTQSEAPAELPPASAAAASVEAPYRLVMLGDSITAGQGLPSSAALPAQLEEALLGEGVRVDVINAGVSGDTSRDALARLDWALGADAEGVLIALGGNDLLQGVDPSETEDNLRALIKAAKARGLDVVLAGMRAAGNYGENYRAHFDAIYPRLAAEEAIPLYPFLLDGVALDPALNQRDGIHPNAQGVAVIVENLAPFLVCEISECD
jgi:acyl-CoA thioesterase-1